MSHIMSNMFFVPRAGRLPHEARPNLPRFDPSSRGDIPDDHALPGVSQRRSKLLSVVHLAADRVLVALAEQKIRKDVFQIKSSALPVVVTVCESGTKILRTEQNALATGREYRKTCELIFVYGGRYFIDDVELPAGTCCSWQNVQSLRADRRKR